MNGGNGAGWGAGGGLNLKKKGCALDPSSYFDFLIAAPLHVWGSYRWFLFASSLNSVEVVRRNLQPLISSTVHYSRIELGIL